MHIHQSWRTCMSHGACKWVIEVHMNESWRTWIIHSLADRLQHTATRCNIPQKNTEEHCHTLQHTATHCNALQHAWRHCNTLKYTAARCNTLQHVAAYCNSLQHTAAQCNLTATHCNTHTQVVLTGVAAQTLSRHTAARLEYTVMGWLRLVGFLKL